MRKIPAKEASSTPMSIACHRVADEFEVYSSISEREGVLLEGRLSALGPTEKSKLPAADRLV